MRLIQILFCSLFLFSNCSSSEETWLKEAKTRLQKGELQPALDATNKALSKNPGFAEAHNLKGVILFQQKNTAEAEQSYLKALEIKPSYYAANLNMVDIQMGKNDWKTALKYAQASVKIAPDSSEAYLKRGIILAALGDVQAGINDFTKTTALNPKNIDAWYNRGNIYFQQKNYPNALQDFEKCIQINPKFGKAFYAMGLSYFYSNSKEKACLSLKQAQDLDYPGAQQAWHQICED